LPAKSDTPLVPAGEEDGALAPAPTAAAEPAAT